MGKRSLSILRLVRSKHPWLIFLINTNETITLSQYTVSLSKFPIQKHLHFYHWPHEWHVEKVCNMSDVPTLLHGKIAQTIFFSPYTLRVLTLFSMKNSNISITWYHSVEICNSNFRQNKIVFRCYAKWFCVIYHICSITVRKKNFVSNTLE